MAAWCTVSEVCVQGEDRRRVAAWCTVGGVCVQGEDRR